MTKPTPYEGNEPFIFISYARKNSETVYPLIQKMQYDGYRVWYDEGIDPGTEWNDSIAEHVENCGYFIAFISKNYLASDNCMDELNYACDSNRKRLLVYLENVSLPGSMKMRLNRLQAIHKYRYESEEDFFEKLYTADGLEIFKNDATRENNFKGEYTMTKPTPYEGNEPFIFISYARKNSETVYPLIQKMQYDGYRAWYDDGIAGSTNWKTTIAEHVLKCGFFIIFLTKESCTSEWCERELDYAVNKKKPVLPIYLEDVQLPPSIELTLGGIHAFKKYEFVNERDFFNKIYLSDGFQKCKGNTNKNTPKSIDCNPDDFEIVDGVLVKYKGNNANIFIPDSVTSIGEYAFLDCDSLTSVTIPDSVTSIGERAFYFCDGLTSITIPSSVTNISNYAFVGCSSLTSITVDEDNAAYKSIEGNLYTKDGKTLTHYAIGKTSESFVIPNSVTSIGFAAFFACYSLKSITIPDSVTSIGFAAFTSCDSLKTINYRGTKEQWNAIKKGGNWDTYASDYKIKFKYKGK